MRLIQDDPRCQGCRWYGVDCAPTEEIDDGECPRYAPAIDEPHPVDPRDCDD